MRFDTKIAIAVRSDLAVWQKLNVTAFLASAIGAGVDEVAGKPYEDGSGNRYLEMFRQPVLVYAGPGETLAAPHPDQSRRAGILAGWDGSRRRTGRGTGGRRMARSRRCTPGSAGTCTTGTATTPTPSA